MRIDDGGLKMEIGEQTLATPTIANHTAFVRFSLIGITNKTLSVTPLIIAKIGLKWANLAQVGSAASGLVRFSPFCQQKFVFPTENERKAIHLDRVTLRISAGDNPFQNCRDALIFSA
jgi:hypothetical protein